MMSELGRGVEKRNLCFCLDPLFWRRPTSTAAAIKDQEQEEHVIGGDAATDAKCEPIASELASKNVIM